MNTEPVLTARQQSALWRKNMLERYPHSFTFWERFDDYPATSDEQFEEMAQWIQIHAGYKGVHWNSTSSPLGTSLTYWFRDADLAMRFKLTFVGTHG